MASSERVFCVPLLILQIFFISCNASPPEYLIQIPEITVNIGGTVLPLDTEQQIVYDQASPKIDIYPSMQTPLPSNDPYPYMPQTPYYQPPPQIILLDDNSSNDDNSLLYLLLLLGFRNNGNGRSNNQCSGSRRCNSGPCYNSGPYYPAPSYPGPYYGCGNDYYDGEYGPVVSISFSPNDLCPCGQ